MRQRKGTAEKQPNATRKRDVTYSMQGLRLDAYS